MNVLLYGSYFLMVDVKRRVDFPLFKLCVFVLPFTTSYNLDSVVYCHPVSKCPLLVDPLKFSIRNTCDFTVHV
jgi:hypothetical protein